MSKYRKEDLEHLSRIFKALSNPNRLEIFLKMMSGCIDEKCCSGNEWVKCCQGDFIKKLGLAPSTVSHHIKELKHAGLIKIKRKGKGTECWLDEHALLAMTGLFKLSGEKT
jgi:ArsR family transcriptional regulator